MSFISLDYLIFFSIVFLLYHVLSHRLQNLMLLAASYVFYGLWSWRFLGLIFAASVVAFFCALTVGPTAIPRQSQRPRLWSLWLNILFSLALLCFFKYFNFFGELFNVFCLFFGGDFSFPAWNIILPVGISFFTFRTISYTVDVYRGNLRPTRNFLDFLLYVSFFPQVLAGPIERGNQLLPQISAPRKTSWRDVGSGVQLAFWGFFQKMVIADNMAVIVNKLMATQELNQNGAAVAVATYAFAFQIYGDFAGYTNIARGCARMIGFESTKNFYLPYLAANPQEFWRRWHISLSSWLKDYLYIPLGGNKNGWWKTQFNLAITFLLGGLWHGASWNFVIWGAYHALLLFVFHAIDRFGKPVVRSVAESSLMMRDLFKIIGFFQLTCIGWLIFRVRDMGTLTKMGRAFFSISSGQFKTGLVAESTILLVVIIVPFTCFEVYQARKKDLEPWLGWSSYSRIVFNLFLSYAILLFGAPDTREFVYFQF